MIDSRPTSLNNLQSPNNEAYRKVKGWYNLYQQHRRIPAELVANLNYNKRKIFYRIFITEVDNIQAAFSQSETTKPYIKFNMTFFNTAKKKFYGRTYSSRPYPLVSQNGPFQLADPINIFFYSTIDKGNENILVVEASVLEIASNNVVIKNQPLGWCVMEVYDSQSINSKRVSFYNGTPRVLFDSNISIYKNELPTRLNFRVFELEGFEEVENLLDEAVLCGADDVLPGVMGRALPDSLTENIMPPKLEPTMRIFLEDIVVEVPEALENDLIRSAQLFRATQYGLTPEMERKLSDVFVSERRLIVAFHNSWTAVNSRKFKNMVILHRDNTNRAKMLYVFSGSLDCDGIFADECACLIFQLEYTMNLPRPDGKMDTWNTALGWKPVLLTNFTAGEINVREGLIKGPGKTPNFQKLFEPNPNILEQITVYGRINLTKMPRISSMMAVTEGNRPQSQNLDKNDSQLFNMKVLLAEKERELERLQLQHQKSLEQARRTGEMQGYEKAKSQAPGQNYDQGTSAMGNQGYSSGYGGSIEPAQNELIDHYRNETTKTRLEVESIKNILYDIQTQNKLREEEERQRYETNRFDADKLKNLDYYMSQTSPSKNTAEYGQPQVTTQFHTREISRADKALLIQSGIKGILDNAGDYDAQQIDESTALDAEIRDSNKASIILIQFLAIKASQHAIFRDSIKPLDIGHDNYELPQKVYFTYNFFDLPGTKTETIALEKPKDLPSDPSMLKYGAPYYLVRDTYLKTGTDTKEPILRYEIDPSVDQQYQRHVDFAKYLYAKSLTVDIWDAESLMLFGSVKVPLRELMRQGKQISTFSKEFDIIEPSFMRSKGSLQILLKNIGKQPNNELPKPKQTMDKTGKPMYDLSKKKIKSKKKINLPEEFKSGTVPLTRYDDEEEKALSPDQRKQERINNYKMAAIEMNLNVMMSNEEFAKEKHRKELREISNFRDTKKVSTLKQALNQQFKEEKTVNVMFGRVEIIPVEVTNYYSYDTAFTVNINDPDEVFLGKGECSVITSGAEWKFWADRKSFATPPEWNMISPNNNSFVLKSGEKVEILLKYVTLRNYNTEYQRDYASGRVSANDIRRKTYVATRVINVTISETNGRVITGTKLEIVPSSPIVDHVFRFFEQENRNVTLYLPALYHYSLPPAHKPILMLNYQKAVVDWLNDREITLQLKVPAAQSQLRFNLLAYSDSFLSDLLGNFVIEINSCAGVDVNVNMGQLTSIKLTLPADTSRMARCYVSHPSLGYFPNPFDKPFALTPASINAVTMNVRSFNVKPQTVLVNCVDVGTKELIYAWIVKLIGTEPNVTRKYEFTVRCGMDSHQKFIYENRSPSFCIYEFVSSHPDILQPVEKNVHLEGGQKENIRIRIAARDEPSIAEVCLFASDTEEKIFECLLFQIKYVN